MNNEEQHIEIREKLRKLPRVKAREGFENELLRRINLLDAETVKIPASKSSFWESLFGKKSLAWTIPATSLAVIAIVFIGVYFAFYKSKDMQNTPENKSSANQQSGVELLKSFSESPDNKKGEIPGKDIANDLEIGKSPKSENKQELDKGLNENYFEQTPKPIAPSKTNVIDSKKETTIYEKAEDVGKTGKTIKQADEKESGVNKGALKEEKKMEESVRSKDTEIKKSSPLIKDVEKIKSEKGNSDAKVKEETNNKEDTRIKEEAKIKEETKRKEEAKIKEEIKKKEDARIKEEIKKKEDARKKEELRKKEEAKRKEEARKKEESKTKEKEDLEKLKEKIKDN